MAGSVTGCNSLDYIKVPSPKTQLLLILECIHPMPKPKMTPQSFCFCLLLLSGSTTSLPAFPGQADLVTSLPGVDFPIAYKQYSGYLELHDHIKFHYWLFEAQFNSETSPVVQWLNGGPGTSGLFGAFTELGPLRMNINGTITPNPYAWNLKTNLLIIESPVDVGFSYQVNASAHFTNHDNSTAELNFSALKLFFAKYPHFLSNDFYITGESYAGRFIPQLARLVIKAKFPTHFKGTVDDI